MQLLHAPALKMNADALLQDCAHYFGRMLGRGSHVNHGALSPGLFEALAYATRTRLMERWSRTNNALQSGQHRRAHYISLEFLMGRLLRNALLSLGIQDQAADALQRIGVELEDVYEYEHDAGLGNGGLGRLAACLLDSCATLRLPVIGYGIRYRYGMFRQRLENGCQIEEPDPWLRGGFPWEIKRIELSRTVKFGGRCLTRIDQDRRTRHRWVDTHDVLAVPFDVPIPGYRNDVVNTLRLWSAAATDEFDLEEFNAGSYADAVAAKNEAENITMVLYPNNESENGQELRLRQQYFLVSASLQDVLSDWQANHGDGNDNDFADFAANNCFQLNDTHPAIAVPELMRLLMDEHGLRWSIAWDLTRQTMAYTNHTLLPEALELWPQAMIGELLPRIMEIINEINKRFRAEVSARWPGDRQRLERMSLIQSGPTPMVRMAYLAIVGSYSVNGVAELHSRLLRHGLFKDFAEHWPEKFNNKTNGVTQRRWLAHCNPGLSALITSKIGADWITDLEQLARLRDFAAEPTFHADWRAVKSANKIRLARVLEQRVGTKVDAAMLFDVQVKRIHEYKRQLLNLLHVVHLYDRIRRGDGSGLVPRLVIIGGKAAPGYVMAKNVIKCINDVARVINADAAMKGRLQLIFYPDYNVSAMELICPATDLSEQISTAGKEASGTGNMKFMMNGALTMGTLDGANVEIRQAVGEQNFFLFGLSVDEIAKRRSDYAPHYHPQAIIDRDPDFSRVLQLLQSGHFNQDQPAVFDAVIHALRDPADAWMTAADFRSFIEAQARADAAFQDAPRWTRMSILNTAASGRFSTDRTIRDYNREIWRLKPIQPARP
ncbi:glycogen/starch/alpha-glucan phosphorylase [Candidatus Spongiihabitans sp.]|uniref:glycogen/starch/alpha-glucan phosphorylase n=1 Tax=Candidatus Spongiihabitans sp. TaxID=3101308 RepID=UPI003C7E935E